MRRAFASLVVIAVAAIATTGCWRNTTPTDSGGKKSSGEVSSGSEKNKDKTFTLAPDPAKEIKIAQGGNQKVTINVARGKECKDKITVALKTEAKGLTIAKDKNELDPTTKEVSVTLTAAKDAPPGKFEITVTGSGGDQTQTATISGEVTKKSD